MTKLNILYIHGFGSQVDPDGDKQVALRKIAHVSAFAPDYSQGDGKPGQRRALPAACGSGELPHSHFYDAEHNIMMSHSGILTEEKFKELFSY